MSNTAAAPTATMRYSMQVRLARSISCAGEGAMMSPLARALRNAPPRAGDGLSPGIARDVYIPLSVCLDR